MKRYIYIFVIIMMTQLMGCSGKKTEEKENQILCDKFELVTKVKDSTLNLSVDTDLPNNTVVMVSISRSYLRNDNSTTYSENYFSERSTIGKWKSEHNISIADEVWKTALRNRQESVSRSGYSLGIKSIDVESISDKITASMVVPINQPDPKFGDRNKNLTGKAITVFTLAAPTFEEIHLALKSKNGRRIEP